MTTAQSKPLELHIYPRSKDHHGRPCYLDGDGKELWLTEEIATQEADLKHLSNAEIAAEWHQARFEQAIVAIGPGPIDRMRHFNNTLHRFATTPHYWQSA